MGGRLEDDHFVAEVTVARPAADVWQSLVRVDEHGQPAWLGVWPRAAEFESTGAVTDVREGESMRVHKHSEPCRDSEILLAIDAREADTRVLVVQSSLPEWVHGSPETFVVGGDQIVADLVLYLERGVVVSRHSMPWAFPGFVACQVAAGLEVSWVMPGGYAERAGLEPGDLLISLGEAPVVTQLCLQALLRVHRSGRPLPITWVRGSELREGIATL